jgi:hypothetical protein
VPGHGVLEFLVGGGEQLFGHGEVRGGAAGRAVGQIDLGPQRQRACLPDRVPGPAQQRQGAEQVLQRGVVPAEAIVHRRPPKQDPPPQRAVRPGCRPVELGEALTTAPAPRQCDSERGAHVRLAVGMSGSAGQPQCEAELGDRAGNVAAIPQNDGGGVVCDRGVVFVRMRPEHGAGLRQGLLWPGQREG